MITYAFGYGPCSKSGKITKKSTTEKNNTKGKLEVLIFNAHGSMKRAPDMVALHPNKKVKFLCKAGQLLFVKKMIDFIDKLFSSKNLEKAMVKSGLHGDAYCDFTIDELLEHYKDLIELMILTKSDEEWSLLKKVEKKLDNFLKLMCSSHPDDVKHVVHDLRLRPDFKVDNRACEDVASYLRDTKNFNTVVIDTYGFDEVNCQLIRKPSKFNLMYNPEELQDGRLDVVYITLSQQVGRCTFSHCLKQLEHAYIAHENGKFIQAFIILDNNEYLYDAYVAALNNDLQHYYDRSRAYECFVNDYDVPPLDIYDFGKLNCNIVLGSCRTFQDEDGDF